MSGEKINIALYEWQIEEVVAALRHCARRSHRNVGIPFVFDDLSELFERELDYALRRRRED